ncbi:hypothetical protein [Mesorhizobium sp. M0011]|uniref:hypothetical protein n=1 Tax=Mesorhizobium sp. M0011 TaxID=2956839 RepID=UPI003334D9A9
MGAVIVSASKTFALWMRLTALVAAVLFVISACMILWGAPLHLAAAARRRLSLPGADFYRLDLHASEGGAVSLCPLPYQTSGLVDRASPER